MEYTVRLTDDAEADLRGLSPNTRHDVNAVLERLRSGTDRELDLSLQEADELWRAKAGRRWRVVFEVRPGREIVVRRIRHRRDAYRGIEHPHRRDVREPKASYEAPQPPTCAGAVEQFQPPP